MLQNRVDPFGNIIRTAARGMFTGTRGVLHDEHKEIVRPFKLKAWLTCLLEFKGRKRIMMTPDRYTELFFLDEATALAAGHRPCAECRRSDFNRFKNYWLQGNPEYEFSTKTSIYKIDEILHQERINHNKEKVVYESRLNLLPDGVFVSIDGLPYLLIAGSCHLWTPHGYRTVMSPNASYSFSVLTPRSIVNALIAGYVPQIVLGK